MELIKNLKRTLRGLDEQADELNGFYDAIIRRNDEMAQELDRRYKLNAEVMQALRRCQEMIVKLAEAADGDLRQEGMIYANILEGLITNDEVKPSPHYASGPTAARKKEKLIKDIHSAKGESDG